MRKQVNVSRERVPVRLKIQVDGQTLFDQSVRPRGLRSDGPSIAVARFPVSAGRHEIKVDLADTADTNAWTKSWNQTVEFQTNQIRVVLFETKSGFSLH
jgi:hypothetical protein